MNKNYRSMPCTALDDSASRLRDYIRGKAAEAGIGTRYTRQCAHAGLVHEDCESIRVYLTTDAKVVAERAWLPLLALAQRYKVEVRLEVRKPTFGGSDFTHVLIVTPAPVRLLRITPWDLSEARVVRKTW